MSPRSRIPGFDEGRDKPKPPKFKLKPDIDITIFDQGTINRLVNGGCVGDECNYVYPYDPNYDVPLFEEGVDPEENPDLMP